MRTLAMMVLGVMLATTATSCIFAAKKGYDTVKDKVSDEKDE